MQTILAIESSCDETAAAVVRGGKVLASIVASQPGVHDAYGGVVPELASRRHLEVVEDVIDPALREAGIDPSSAGPGRAPTGIDAIAVTTGPGLIGALLVGVSAAKTRAWAWDIPLISVDHLLGHVASAQLGSYAAAAGNDDIAGEVPADRAADGPDSQARSVDETDAVAPPMLCLLASGGHTLALDVGPEMQLALLGSTRDDAAGEAFDKGARLLGLSMPGGPAIERLAAAGSATAVPFTPAMVHHHDTLDTSFSGLKTALAMTLRALPDGVSDADVAASYQAAIVATLAGMARKLLRARGPQSGHPDARHTLAVVGGVAANQALLVRLYEICREFDVRLVTVPLRYCGDNAAMIGVAAPYVNPLNDASMLQVDAIAASQLFRSGSLMPTVAIG
ncbi:MAG: tRNA (adenosine(37)-N6)-threonylcarbamoyltransferase complex transferase subunit TsaD [Thermoleophilia bacterium]|nr:tRNA (adenosine(37)-N6)-threonylcarbamoyltransferase complex transferase subunit TsaD [Thermoleophilia bacterium]